MFWRYIPPLLVIIVFVYIGIPLKLFISNYDQYDDHGDADSAKDNGDCGLDDIF